MYKYDFSQNFNNNSLDTLMSPCDSNNSRQDQCGECDGVCLHNIPPTILGNQFVPYQPEKLLTVLIFNQKYGKYLSYDAHNTQVLLSPLYLINSNENQNINNNKINDALWNLQPNFTSSTVSIYTIKSPHLFLETTKQKLYSPSISKLGLSYFVGGKEQEWQLFKTADNQIIIRQNNLYLSTDGYQIYLDHIPQLWQITENQKVVQYTSLTADGTICPQNKKLVFTTPYASSCVEKFQSFPDNPQSTLNKWNKYYSDFWNGEYVYGKTTPTNNNYFIINLDPKGAGFIYTNENVWKVNNISGDQLKGCNNNSIIYVEMLKQGQPGYNPNLPQIRILTQDTTRQNAPWQSLSSDNPYNLRAYSIKVSDTPNKLHSGGFPNNLNLININKECFNNFQTRLAQNQILTLDPPVSGYNSEKVNLDYPPQCIIDRPTNPIKNVGYAQIYPPDTTLRTHSSEIYYTYYSQCGESLSSPIALINLTNETTRLTNPILDIPMPNNNTVQGAKVYIRPTGTNQWQFVGNYNIQNKQIRAIINII